MQSPAEFPEAYKKSVEAADEAAFLSLYENQVYVFDMWDDWSLTGITAWKNMAKDWFASMGQEKLKVTFSDVDWKADAHISFLTAFVRFAAHDANGDQLRFLDERFTAALRKQPDGTWKVAHQHTSAPIGSDTIAALLKRS